MVRAILEGRKSQTRRVVKLPKPDPIDAQFPDDWKERAFFDPDCLFHGPCLHVPTVLGDDEWWMRVPSPYGIPGDRLYVRECWRPGGHSDEPVSAAWTASSIHYKADADECSGGPWKPSIHMPKWAARIWLEILSVKISGGDALAEGVRASPGPYDKPADHNELARRRFRDLWDSINGKRPGCSWADNPWVWCLEFKPIRKEG